jgi:hypothetical protein
MEKPRTPKGPHKGYSVYADRTKRFVCQWSDAAGLRWCKRGFIRRADAVVYGKERAAETVRARYGVGPPSPRIEASVRANVVTYFVRFGNDGPIKIGVARNLKSRLGGMQTSSPVPLTCIGFIPGNREYGLHYKFRKIRLAGEWFEPIPELLAYIEQNAQKP